MKRFILLIVFMSLCLNVKAQIAKDSIDSKYLEDQIYLGLTYNLLLNKPANIAQNGFSGGFSFGFIKDIPVNNERNKSIGIGLGYSYNTFIQNLKITKVNNNIVFETAQNYSTNRFGLSSIEMPIELRWRGSTPSKYKFWRVYAGFKMSYILASKTLFRDNVSSISTINIAEINKFQYGLTIAAGFSTWNLYAYYGLNPLFDNVVFNNKSLNLKELNIGLKFYIM